jgi:DNA-binding NarL/FixJ family response regulator
MNQNENTAFSAFKRNDARIILADDDLNVRSALKLLLDDEAGLEVVGEVENAQDLVEQAEAICPEIILLDWELPTLQVEEHVQELKDHIPHLLVVAMSGRPESRQSALKTGADAFICKGDSPEHLLAIIRDLGFIQQDLKPAEHRKKK